jgi:hypothetical protein
MRLYDHLKPRVVFELFQALSKIHLSFDGCTAKGSKRGFLGVVAHIASKRGRFAIALNRTVGGVFKPAQRSLARVVLHWQDAHPSHGIYRYSSRPRHPYPID